MTHESGAVCDDLEAVYSRSKTLVILLTEDASTEPAQPAGYLLLDVGSIEPSTGEPQVFLHDLAVLPAYWGRRVGHQLVEAATHLAAERGLKYLVGMVSVNNRRARTGLSRSRLRGRALSDRAPLSDCSREGMTELPSPDSSGYTLPIPAFR